MSDSQIWLDGKIAPGPDYRLYLIPEFVETEDDFIAIKDQEVEVAMIKAFENFAVDALSHIAVQDYPALLIWCEACSSSPARLTRNNRLRRAPVKWCALRGCQIETLSQAALCRTNLRLAQSPHPL